MHSQRTDAAKNFKIRINHFQEHRYHNINSPAAINNLQPGSILLINCNVVITRKLYGILLSVLIAVAVVTAALSVNVDKLDGDPAFEKAVAIIKKYESLHTARNWPYVGYGHRVQKGDPYKKGDVLNEADAEAQLRKDLKKFIKMFDSYGNNALILGVISYNIGPTNVKKSSVIKLLEKDRDKLRAAYLSHCRYKGKKHQQILRRRTEEFDTLFGLLLNEYKQQ